ALANLKTLPVWRSSWRPPSRNGSRARHSWSRAVCVDQLALRCSRMKRSAEQSRSFPRSACRGLQRSNVAAAIEQFLHKRVLILPPLSRSRDHGWHGWREREEYSLRMGQLADFGGRKGNSLPRRNESEQGRKVLD